MQTIQHRPACSSHYLVPAAGPACIAPCAVCIQLPMPCSRIVTKALCGRSLLRLTQYVAGLCPRTHHARTAVSRTSSDARQAVPLAAPWLQPPAGCCLSTLMLWVLVAHGLRCVVPEHTDCSQVSDAGSHGSWSSKTRARSEHLNLCGHSVQTCSALQVPSSCPWSCAVDTKWQHPRQHRFNCALWRSLYSTSPVHRSTERWIASLMEL